MRFRLRYLAFPPLALSVLFLTASGKELRTPLGDHPVVHAVSVPLVPGDASRHQIGRLRYLGGVRLTSPHLSLHDVEMVILSIHVQLCIHNLFSGFRIPLTI